MDRAIGIKQDCSTHFAAPMQSVRGHEDDHDMTETGSPVPAPTSITSVAVADASKLILKAVEAAAAEAQAEATAEAAAAEAIREAIADVHT